MWRNESGIDRALRLGVGGLLMTLAFVGPKTRWGWIGALPFATGLVGFCPLYRLLGISTCHVEATSANLQHHGA